MLFPTKLIFVSGPFLFSSYSSANVSTSSTMRSPPATTPSKLRIGVLHDTLNITLFSSRVINSVASASKSSSEPPNPCTNTYKCFSSLLLVIASAFFALAASNRTRMSVRSVRIQFGAETDSLCIFFNKADGSETLRLRCFLSVAETFPNCFNIKSESRVVIVRCFSLFKFSSLLGLTLYTQRRRKMNFAGKRVQNQRIRRRMDFRGTGILDKNFNDFDDGFEEEREKKMEDRNEAPM